MTTLSRDVRPTAETKTPDIIVKTFDLLDGELLEAAWRLYEEAFRELNTKTVQRHLMYRHEFNDVMADRRIGKYVAYTTDGTMTGLSTYTNDLAAVPLISTDYFKTRWPEHYAQKRIWWIGFVAVDVASRGSRTFYHLVDTMYAVAERTDGITGIDYAEVNIDLRLPEISTAYLRRINRRYDRVVDCQQVDYQGYYLYHFPYRDHREPRWSLIAQRPGIVRRAREETTP